MIDQRIKEHLGQAAAFQVGAPFNQHLLSFPGGVPRPRLPILPTPGMPLGVPQVPGAPLMPGVRPPILPAPGIPGNITLISLFIITGIFKQVLVQIIWHIIPVVYTFPDLDSLCSSIPSFGA